MLRAHRVADIRAAETAAAKALGPDVLMQRAAEALAERLQMLLPEGSTPVMLIGPGNNGGDALYAAERLCRDGRAVDLCLLDPAESHLDGLSAATAAGAKVVDTPTGHDFVVDALFGIGARPGLSGPKLDRWLEWFDLARPYIVAVDTPSGIGVDTGTLEGSAVRADSTCTFGTYKVGLLAGPAAELSGPDPATLVDIGLEEFLGAPALEVIEASDGPRWAAALTPRAHDHKYSRGVLGISAGSLEYPGAAHLCVAGAQAGPAGMVRYVGSNQLAVRVVDRAPEVVAGTGPVQAWVVGPGGSGSGGPLQVVLGDGVPVVVDASALTHLPERFTVDALLTPHAGELASMLGLDRAAVEADPVSCARRAAERWQATVLLKGHHTVVAAPDGRCRANWSGTSWLGTAGSGDVLAGFCGSLLAHGLSAFDAGSLGAFLHGAAGVRANPGGPVTASMIATWLPVVYADFLAGALGEVRW